MAKKETLPDIYRLPPGEPIVALVETKDGLFMATAFHVYKMESGKFAPVAIQQDPWPEDVSQDVPQEDVEQAGNWRDKRGLKPQRGS